MIKALFKFAKMPANAIVIDTTSNNGEYRELSPFVLSAAPAKRFENLWQYSKVYYPEHVDKDWNPNHIWYEWRQKGFSDSVAHRYPMGKGRIPRFSMWNGKKLDYIQARKQIYAPEYARNVITTDSYARLRLLYNQCIRDNRDLILLDYDAYDHLSLGMTLDDVINNPKRKMGHAFVLLMLLADILPECLLER